MAQSQHPYLESARRTSYLQEYELLPLKKNESDYMNALVERTNAQTGLRFQFMELEDELFPKRSANVINYVALVCDVYLKDVFIKAGYYGESIRLEAAGLDLDTGWITSGFDAKVARNLFEMEDDEAFFGVVALGYGEESRGVMRMLSRKKQRKPEEFFSGIDDAPDWALNGAQLAVGAPLLTNPGTVNMECANGIVTIHFDESKPMESIEAGILMLQFEIGASCGRWLRNPADNVWSFADMRRQ